MSGARRTDASAAVSGLFASQSATGGLARRDPEPAVRPAAVGHREARLRVGVEVSESDVDFLRSLSRPARTGQRRSLGSKFVASGVLAAAIELIDEHGIDMEGVEHGDLDEMTARAREAMTRVALTSQGEPSP